MPPTSHPTPDTRDAPRCPPPVADGGARRHEDPRFTFGLLYDVAKAIERHGYDDVLRGSGITELSMHLFAFLHGTDEGRDGHCFGMALVQAQQRDAQHGQGQRQ